MLYSLFFSHSTTQNYTTASWKKIGLLWFNNSTTNQWEWQNFHASQRRIPSHWRVRAYLDTTSCNPLFVNRCSSSRTPQCPSFFLWSKRRAGRDEPCLFAEELDRRRRSSPRGNTSPRTGYVYSRYAKCPHQINIPGYRFARLLSFAPFSAHFQNRCAKIPQANILTDMELRISSI